MTRISLVTVVAVLGGGFAARELALSRHVISGASAASPIVQVAPDPTGNAASAQEVAAMREGLLRLSAEVASLHNQAARTAASAESKPNVALDSSPRSPEMLAESARAWHDHMAEIQLQFQSEAKDSAWSSQAFSSVVDAVNANEAMRGIPHGVECRSSTCRVEFDDESGDVTKNLQPFLKQVMPALPRVEADVLNDGTPQRKVVLYLMRGLQPE